MDQTKLTVQWVYQGVSQKNTDEMIRVELYSRIDAAFVRIQVDGSRTTPL